jgi:phosphatidylglycerol---prolipoprotein diacylglyceryl transferase
VFPKLISTGDFFLPTYGVLVALAFVAGLMITTRLAKRVHMNHELVVNLVVYCALAGLAGAKLLMFLFDWDYFTKNPMEIFSLSTLRAAGVYQGGLVLAIAMAFYYTRKHAMPLLQTFDVFAPGIALGHGIGKLGCFAAGCCWGKECDLPWAVTFRNPDANALTGVPLRVRLHPAQLYEFGAEILLFAYLYWRFGKTHKPGRIIAEYLILSSALRFGIEFTRFHEQALPFGLPFSITQWIAIGLAGLGVVLLRSGRARERKPEPSLAH